MNMNSKKFSALAWTSRLLACASLVAAMTVAEGCASPEDIDRVQPDLIKKSDLEGEWYSLGTVTRAPYASSAAFPGLQGSLERGVWRIEQNQLYFYRTYEVVEGAERQGIRADVDVPLEDKDGNPVRYEKTRADGSTYWVTRYEYRSAPIKRFNILGHVDVRQQYNPITGEASNIRVEDGSEKYWFERQWMRVDFGSNSANNFADVSFWSNPNGDLAANFTIYEGDEGPEDIQIRVQDEGKYMDFVVRGFINGPREWLEGWGWVPTCLFYPWWQGAFYECDEEEIHVRTSFMRVPEENSYQALDWNDHLMNKFGYYRSARSFWDERYGQTWSGAERPIRRFRIWEDYIKNEAGELDYKNMTPKPVVYYLTENFPRELLRGSKDLADNWNHPFQQVVEHHLGASLADLHAQDPERYPARMFVVCENNMAEVEALKAADPTVELAETDPRYCKDMDRAKLVGDLRYNMLASINEPVQYGLYGYGPMHSDPLSGETVHANAFQYTANIRQGARTAVDMIEYAAGVQDFVDITQARHIETRLRSRQLRGSQNDPKRTRSLESLQTEAMQVVPASVVSGLAAAGLGKTDTDVASSRMQRLLQTDEFDSLWLNEDMAALAGFPIHQLGVMNGAQARDLNQIAHPAHLGSEDMLSWKFERDMEMGKHAMCKKEFFDDSFSGLALEYKAEYDAALCNELQGLIDSGAEMAFNFGAFNEPTRNCDADPTVCTAGESCRFVDQGEFSGNYCVSTCSAQNLFTQLRKEIRRVNQVSQFAYWDPNALYTDTRDARVSAAQRAARDIVERIRTETFLDVYDRMWSTIAMHEVGHNVGLRHNFASSTDALNYFQDFWDFKGADNGNGWEPDTLFTSDTDEQVRNRIREYQQTSIMEYSGSFNARFQGLGAYDTAAILYGYGELVEVFKNPPAPEAWTQYLEEPADTNPDQFPTLPRRMHPLGFALNKVHYTNYPKVFGGVENMYEREVVSAGSLKDVSKPCSQHDNPYDPTVCGDATSFCQPFSDGFFCTKPGVLEVPYRFCSDEYNWTSPDCQTWDEGTDVFDIIDNQIMDYETYWPFRAYRRDNILFNPMTSYYGRLMMDMYGFRKMFEHWALDLARYNHNDWWEKKFGTPWHLDINGGLGRTLASRKIFEYLANIFGRPSDGFYGFNQQRRVYEPVVDNGANTYTNIFQVREDVGARAIYPRYDFDGYIFMPYSAGTFFDRMAAMMFMTFPTTMFTVGVDRTYDLKRFRLNFGTIWPQRMHTLFSGIIANATNLYGWCVEHDGVGPIQGGTGDPIRVKPRMWFGTKQELDDYYSNCTPLNPEPQYDFPQTQYRLPALAAIYGMGWMSYTYDRSFIDRNRLWLKGDATEVNMPEGFATIEYADPFSGKTFVAAYDPTEEDPSLDLDPRDSVPDGDLDEHKTTFWPAARLLAFCNRELARYGGNLSDLSATYQYSRLQETVGRVEILRGLYRVFDHGF